MTTGYTVPRRRGLVASLLRTVDEFMSWLLYGHETWLVALLKGVPLFLLVYFVLGYIPNYAYYAVTLFVFDFSGDVGYLVATSVGGGTFVAIIILVLWTQAARGRSGFGWSLIRYLDFVQYLGAMLVIIPFMAFNLAGGSLIPPIFSLESLGLGVVTAGMGAASLVYLWFEYRRVVRRQAMEAAAASASA
jgi:hypothetical protein